MSRNSRTPSTILVTPLDLSAACAEVVEWLNKHREIDGKVAVTSVDAEKWGVVETPHGLYALVTEGVGSEKPISDENPLEVHFWIRGYADKEEGSFISMAPACSIKLDADEVRKYATGDPVPLHDFIRSFGARLENNYYGWKGLLEEISAPAAH